MHFLYGHTQDRKPVIVHAIGFSEENGSGFYDNESIYEVEQVPTPEGSDKITMRVIKEIGVVRSENGHLRFDYTDPDFKSRIKYDESCGYSTLDGGLLVNTKTHEQFMYVSAHNPIGLNVTALQVALSGRRSACPDAPLATAAASSQPTAESKDSLRRAHASTSQHRLFSKRTSAPVVDDQSSGFTVERVEPVAKSF